MKLRRIFSPGHATKVENEHLRAENARFLGFRLADKQRISQLEAEIFSLRKQLSAAERKRDQEGKFR